MPGRVGQSAFRIPREGETGRVGYSALRTPEAAAVRARVGHSAFRSPDEAPTLRGRVGHSAFSAPLVPYAGRVGHSAFAAPSVASPVVYWDGASLRAAQVYLWNPTTQAFVLLS